MLGKHLYDVEVPSSSNAVDASDGLNAIPGGSATRGCTSNPGPITPRALKRTSGVFSADFAKPPGSSKKMSVFRFFLQFLRNLSQNATVAVAMAGVRVRQQIEVASLRWLVAR